MYSAKYISDTGKEFIFGQNGNNVFDIDGLSGISIDLGKSQTSGQIGQTINNKSISGKTININGKMFGNNISHIKNNLRDTILPLGSGQLIFNDKYYIYVVVNTAPLISPLKDNGVFSVQFFAQYPFFRETAQQAETIGGIEPSFRFPVNYNEHQYGIKSDARYININNTGNLEVPYKLSLTSTSTSTDVTISNLKTFKMVKVTGDIVAGQVVDIYRDSNNVLRVTSTLNGVVTDILNRLDEDSNLFYLDVGDNLINATDSQGGANLQAQIEFSSAWSAIYET